jgi:hypothetical protein
VGTPDRRWIAMVLSGVTIAALGAPPTELRDQVAAAIAGLSSPRLVERKKAEGRLKELGPIALPHLPPPDLVDSVAAREALRRIRIHLEQQSAEDSLKPTLVKVSGELTAAEIAKELERQARVTITFSEQLSPTRTRRPVDEPSQPFWRLLDSAAAQAGGHWDFAPVPGSIRIELAGADPSEFPTARDWRTTPESFVVRSLAIDTRPLQADRLLRVRLGIAAEPRLRPLFFEFAANSIAATTLAPDESLTCWNPSARYEVAAGTASREWPLTVEYVIPKSNKAATVSLKGEVRALVATGRETIEFEDWWKGRRTWLRRGGATATLGRVRITRNSDETENADVEITLTYDTDAPPLESHQRWVLHQAASLRIANGQLVPFTRSEVSEEQSGGMSVRYTFERVPDCRKTTLVYEPATALLSIPVRFEIGGMQIPAAR